MGKKTMTTTTNATVTVHDDATPSAHYPADGYRCTACGATGTLADRGTDCDCDDGTAVKCALNGAMDYSVTIAVAPTDYLDGIVGHALGWEPNQGEADGWVAQCDDRASRMAAYRALSAAGLAVSRSEGDADSDDAGVLYLWVIVPSINGEITLYRDDANGGMGPCGTPLEGWCSGEIVALANTLTDRSHRALLASMASGVGTEDVEIEVA